MQAELGAEVRDRSAIQIGIVASKPGVAVIGFMGHPVHDIIVTAEKVAIAGAGRDPRRVDPAEQLEGVVTSAVPEWLVDGVEETARFAAPAPPQVHRDGREAFDTCGQVGNATLLNQHAEA